MSKNHDANILKLFKLLNPCRLCPRHCGVNRLSGEKGKCGTGNEMIVSSCNLHFSEEPPISGDKGSGTIFFTGCSLSCLFCQNYPISQLCHGNPMSEEKLVAKMMELQDKGAHNINFVTPTHYAAHMASAVITARTKGLIIPILYNSSGYDDVETLKLLEGIVDIYMPDSKYADDVNAKKYSGADNYSAINKAALKEMFRQVGNLKLDRRGIAKSGLIIRHLVLPGGIAGSKKVLKFIAEEISNKVFLSLMAQYHPANKAGGYPEISKKLTKKEYQEVLEFTEELGFENGWRQEL
jgi:putative pyruvate formate lyase activating enzyme